jgi:hypothetical protein
MNYRVTVFYIVAFFFTGHLFAQHIVKGLVTNKITKERLAYATVYSNEASTVTNENGEFVLRIKDSLSWVAARYVGYKADTFFLNKNFENVQIYLEQISAALHEVVVSAKGDDTPYVLFAEIMQSFILGTEKRYDSKAFFRSYTTVDGTAPAEFFEAYYNVKSNPFGVYEGKLKAGRFLLPKQTSFLNMSSLELIELFKPFFSANEALFPYTPFTMPTWKLLKRNYSIAILDRTPVQKDTLIHFRFIAKDSLNSFSGELFYFVQKHKMEKIILNANHVTKIPFVSIADSANNKFSNLTYSMETGYDVFQKENLLNYIVFNFQFDATSKNQTKHIFTSMKLLLYDYGKIFSLPIFHSVTNKTDYQLITYLPYNDYFFQHNTVIAENGAEKKLREIFSSIPCYDSRIKNDSIPFLPTKFEHWTNNWKPNLKLLANHPTGDARARLRYYKYEGRKADWDSSFALTMMYLDYDCYSDTTVFNTSALINCKNSFLLNPDSVAINYFSLYLDVAKIAADKMLLEARKKYSTHCPSQEEIMTLYDKYNESYQLDMYNVYCNSNSNRRLIFYPAIRKVIKDNLRAAEEIVNNK